MKTLSQVIVREAQSQIEAQDGALKTLPAGKLEKYMQIAFKFLSNEGRWTISWMISHDDEKKSVIDIYNDRADRNKEEYKELCKNLGTLKKKGRLLEIPVFMTKEQFDAIMSKKESPDAIILDLDSEEGRNKVAKQFTPLVWKIVRSFQGKSTLNVDELFSAGMEGLMWAMNGYGKPSKKEERRFAKKEAEGEDVDALKKEAEAKRNNYTFLSYAAYMIRSGILESIKNESHVVRIPTSAQRRERIEKGHNTKSNTVSGDKTVGKDSEGKGKTVFDYIGGEEKNITDMDKEYIGKLWKEVQAKLEKKFTDERTLDIFYHMNSLFGHKKMQAKELMKKYGIKYPSQITAYNFKVLYYIKNDPTMHNIFTQLYTLYKECLNDEDKAGSINMIHIHG